MQDWLQCTLSNAHARVYGNSNWTISYRVCNRKRTTTQIQIMHGTYLHDKLILMLLLKLIIRVSSSIFIEHRARVVELEYLHHSCLDVPSLPHCWPPQSGSSQKNLPFDIHPDMQTHNDNLIQHRKVGVGDHWSMGNWYHTWVQLYCSHHFHLHQQHSSKCEDVGYHVLC